MQSLLTTHGEIRLRLLTLNTRAQMSFDYTQNDTLIDFWQTASRHRPLVVLLLLHPSVAPVLVALDLQHQMQWKTRYANVTTCRMQLKCTRTQTAISWKWVNVSLKCLTVIHKVCLHLPYKYNEILIRTKDWYRK